MKHLDDVKDTKQKEKQSMAYYVIDDNIYMNTVLRQTDRKKDNKGSEIATYKESIRKKLVFDSVMDKEKKEKQ